MQAPPSRRGSLYHAGDMLSFHGWISAPQASWVPYLHGDLLGTALSQKLREPRTAFSKCTTSSCSHSFSALLLFLQHKQHLYNPAVNSQAPLTPPSLSCRKRTTTSVQGNRIGRRNEHIKCLLQSRDKRFNHSLLHRTSWLPSQKSLQSFVSPSQIQMAWVTLPGGVWWRVTPAGQAGSHEEKQPEHTVSDGIQQQCTQ